MFNVTERKHKSPNICFLWNLCLRGLVSYVKWLGCKSPKLHKSGLPLSLWVRPGPIYGPAGENGGLCLFHQLAFAHRSLGRVDLECQGTANKAAINPPVNLTPRVESGAFASVAWGLVEDATRLKPSVTTDNCPSCLDFSESPLPQRIRLGHSLICRVVLLWETGQQYEDWRLRMQVSGTALAWHVSSLRFNSWNILFLLFWFLTYIFSM